MTDFRALCAELLEALENAIRVIYREDGTKHISTADPVIAKADAALAQPEPQGLTNEEIEEAAKLIHASMRFAVPDNHYTSDWVEHGNSLMQDEARRTARAVLARWGRFAIEPVPVSERLPGPEDCDAEGRCWVYWTRGTRWVLDHWIDEDFEQFLAEPLVEGAISHWLPHWALPVPQQKAGQ
jgi:hypothetical protein